MSKLDFVLEELVTANRVLANEGKSSTSTRPLCPPAAFQWSMRREGSRRTSPSCRSCCGSCNQIGGIDSSARRAEGCCRCRRVGTS